MSKKILIFGVFMIVPISVVAWVLWPYSLKAPTNTEMPGPDETIGVITPTQLSTPTPKSTKSINTQEIPNIDSAFNFTAEVPIEWQVEAVPGSQAISIYNSQSKEDTVLDRSQIFIRSFKAQDFLTLSTVTIYSKEFLNIQGRPAVRYDIEKKSGVADFPYQPIWRNERHIVTDIRVSDRNPSIFYVIAKRPDTDPVVYENFLQSIRLLH